MDNPVDEPRLPPNGLTSDTDAPDDDLDEVLDEVLDDADGPDDSLDETDQPDAASDEPPPDIASAALAGARHNARPGGRLDRETRRRNRRDNLRGRNQGAPGRNTSGYSGPGVDPARDPHRIGGLLGDFVSDQGWQRPLAEARVFADWAELVGADIAAHATPQSLSVGELRITAESTAWATQLRLLSSRVLARLVAELGPDVVTKLIITGPAAPSWKHGGRSVRGHRGPRDTYG